MSSVSTPEVRIYDESFDAAADLSSYSHRFVLLSAANQVNICGANGKAIGVLMNAADVTATGHAAEVRIVGIAMVEVLANAPNIVAGNFVEAGANGVGVQSTVDKHNVCGIALAGATADNVLIPVLLTGPFTSSTA